MTLICNGLNKVLLCQCTVRNVNYAPLKLYNENIGTNVSLETGLRKWERSFQVKLAAYCATCFLYLTQYVKHSLIYRDGSRSQVKSVGFISAGSLSRTWGLEL